MSSVIEESNDIAPPKENQENKAEPDNSKILSMKNQRTGPRTRFPSFHHLNSVAVMIVLSASGLVRIEDFAFLVFSLFYMYFLSKIAFPRVSTSAEPPVFGEPNKILSVYVLVAAVIGLFLPTIYIFEGIFEGDKKGVNAATPHLFLLASQVFMEGVAFGGNFPIPIRAFVPIAYNSRRIFTLVDWLKSEFYSVGLEEISVSPWRLFIGRSLAIANMGFWCFNLFGFLLPIYLPKAFKMHYSRLNKGKE